MSTENSDTLQPLYLWPEGANLDDVKAVVLELDLPFKVRPFWYDPRHPWAARVIALGPGFPYLHDHIVPRSRAQLVKSVRWALGLEELEVGPHAVLATLKGILGEGVEESMFVSELEDDETAKTLRRMMKKGVTWT